jgi:hypothetical protein
VEQGIVTLDVVVVIKRIRSFAIAKVDSLHRGHNQTRGCAGEDKPMISRSRGIVDRDHARAV